MLNMRRGKEAVPVKSGDFSIVEQSMVSAIAGRLIRESGGVHA
jgi:hypothetical protein